MAFSQMEILVSMQEDIERLTILSMSRPKKARIEPEYEDDTGFEPNPESILPYLDRWGDLKITSKSDSLSAEADRILAKSAS